MRVELDLLFYKQVFFLDFLVFFQNFCYALFSALLTRGFFSAKLLFSKAEKKMSYKIKFCSKTILLTTGLSPSMVQDSAASSRNVICIWLDFVKLFLSLLEKDWETAFYLSVPLPLSEDRFRLFPFRSPLLGESRLLSFPPATKMFQFTGLPLSELWIGSVVFKVALFGNLRIKACCQLPEAYRWYLRPSSSLSA